MATTVTFNSVSYSVPANGESYTGLNSYLIAIASGCLQKSGGSFTLTAEADFGASFGLKSIYFKSRGTAASAGVVRLANTENIAWRNAANAADVALTTSASDRLTYGGVNVPTISSSDTLSNKTISGSSNTISNIGYSSLAALTSGNILVGNGSNVASSVAVTGDVTISNAGVTAIASGVIVDADISASAAITLSKLAAITAGSVLMGNGSNVATATALTGDVTVNSSGVTAIASGVIVDADVNASAAIARSKLASGTADHVIINSGAGAFSSEAQLAITRGGTGQSTASAALNALLPSQTSNTGKVLSTDGTNAGWAAALTSTLNSANIFVGNGSNVATAVAVTGDVTISNAGVTAIGSGKVTSTMIANDTILDADINSAAGISFSKLATLSSGNILVGNGSNVASSVAVTGDVTISNAGVTAIASGVIVDADISASAAITLSKLAAITAGSVLMGNGSNVATATALTGDVTISSSGVTAIASGVIVNADISTSAAIAHSKLANATAGQVLLGITTTGVITATTVSGDVTITGAGVTAIASGVIVNADVNASAAIDGTKISPNFGSQNIVTTGTITTGGHVASNLYTVTQVATSVGTGGGAAFNIDFVSCILSAYSSYYCTVNVAKDGSHYAAATALLVKSDSASGVGTSSGILAQSRAGGWTINTITVTNNGSDTITRVNVTNTTGDPGCAVRVTMTKLSF